MDEDLIGIDQQLNTLRNWLRNWKFEVKRAAILYGPQGVGKTSSVYKVSKELGYNVIEFNASKDRTVDFFKLELYPILISSGFFTKELVLLDEFEDVSPKAQLQLARALTKTHKPIILTTNDITTIHHKIRLQSIELYYPPPSLQTIVQYVKSKKANVNLQEIRDIKDFRQLKLIIEHGSQGYEYELPQKERVTKALSTGDYSQIQPEDLPILLDNSVYLHGVKLWEFISSLAAYDLTKLPQALKGVKVPIQGRQLHNIYYTKILEKKRKGGGGSG